MDQDKILKKIVTEVDEVKKQSDKQEEFLEKIFQEIDEDKKQTNEQEKTLKTLVEEIDKEKKQIDKQAKYLKHIAHEIDEEKKQIAEQAESLKLIPEQKKQLEEQAKSLKQISEQLKDAKKNKWKNYLILLLVALIASAINWTVSCINDRWAGINYKNGEFDKIDSDICILRDSELNSTSEEFRSETYKMIDNYYRKSLCKTFKCVGPSAIPLVIETIKYNYLDYPNQDYLMSNSYPALVIWGDQNYYINVNFKSIYYSRVYVKQEKKSKRYIDARPHELNFELGHISSFRILENKFDRARFIECLVDLCLLQKISYSDFPIDSTEKIKIIEDLGENNIRYLKLKCDSLNMDEYRQREMYKDLNQIILWSKWHIQKIKSKDKNQFRKDIVGLAKYVANNCQDDWHTNCLYANNILIESEDLFIKVEDATFAEANLKKALLETAIANYKNILDSNEINIDELKIEEIELIFLSMQNYGLCYFLLKKEDSDSISSQLFKNADLFYKRVKNKNKVTARMEIYHDALQDNMD